MNLNFKLTDEERKKIMEKHVSAKKEHNVKKEELKKGLQKPEKKNEKTS
jgi:predicted type IV restriction endonuclease